MPRRRRPGTGPPTCRGAERTREQYGCRQRRPRKGAGPATGDRRRAGRRPLPLIGVDGHGLRTPQERSDRDAERERAAGRCAATEDRGGHARSGQNSQAAGDQPDDDGEGRGQREDEEADGVGTHDALRTRPNPPGWPGRWRQRGADPSRSSPRGCRQRMCPSRRSAFGPDTARDGASRHGNPEMTTTPYRAIRRPVSGELPGCVGVSTVPHRLVGTRA